MDALSASITNYAQETLIPAFKQDQGRTTALKDYLKHTASLVREFHDAGGSGLEVASANALCIDLILQTAQSLAEQKHGKKVNQLAIVAVGGYGRGHLNPGSDVDIFFLFPRSADKAPKELTQCVEELLYLLWDTGFKVGHASRSISECVNEAKSEQQSKTALMDARLISGNETLFHDLVRRFDKDCIQKDQEGFFALRRSDLRSRHRKYSHTVFLQEPHVKESCGGMRDFQNILWVAKVKRGTSDLDALVRERILTKAAFTELMEGYDFLQRVRNELHFHTGKSTDILTLRLQGIVATNFNYPEKSILRRCESFMRDYYRYTRAIFNHTNSLMQIFQLEMEDEDKGGWKRFIPRPKKKREVFNGFIARGGLIYSENADIFKDSPHRLMQLFQYLQLKDLRMSPQMRKLVKANWSLVDKTFRYSKRNRETFRAILERKGEVANALRAMHRVGFLGRYLPEFGAMDCLVQHEFFHRYTADEHTLRCIDQLDALIEDDSREKGLYRKLLTDMEDPYALYLALILHDTGRAENVREHIDGSALLSAQVCTRLQIKGGRRGLITFLVDHHLTFWRFATNRNLDDPAVIEEFANIMRDKTRLRTLLLFTYADSNGTNEEAWSPWKESLMLQLYHSTLQFLEKGKDQYAEHLNEEKEQLRIEVLAKLDEKYHSHVHDHFDRMPRRYFRFRAPENVAIHVRAARRFLKKNAESNHNHETDLRWINRDDRGYTELIVTAWNRTLFLERVCCALASEEINIISADVYTRTDGVVCDIFNVCTKDLQPITDANVRKRVGNTLKKLFKEESYNPLDYLKRKQNFLRKKDPNEGGIPFPVRAFVNNRLSDTTTAIEVQALDRIGLLHDLVLAIGKCGLATVHARICTEKGAAMDTIYVTTPEGEKVEDPAVIEKLESTLGSLVGIPAS